MKLLRFSLRLPGQQLLVDAHILIGCGTIAFQHNIEAFAPV